VESQEEPFSVGLVLRSLLKQEGLQSEIRGKGDGDGRGSRRSHNGAVATGSSRESFIENLTCKEIKIIS
jgi:hypothetical protein